MLNISPKLFENEFPSHHPLRFAQGKKYIYITAKENSSEFLKAFQYREKFLLGHSGVTLWLAQSSSER